MDIVVVAVISAGVIDGTIMPEKLVSLNNAAHSVRARKSYVSPLEFVAHADDTRAATKKVKTDKVDSYVSPQRTDCDPPMFVAHIVPQCALPPTPPESPEYLYPDLPLLGTDVTCMRTLFFDV